MHPLTDALTAAMHAWAQGNQEEVKRGAPEVKAELPVGGRFRLEKVPVGETMCEWGRLRVGEWMSG